MASERDGTAADAALGTPELLVLILERCQTTTIVRARRVCRYWLENIDKAARESHIRKKLFLAPLPNFDNINWTPRGPSTPPLPISEVPIVILHPALLQIQRPFDHEARTSFEVTLHFPTLLAIRDTKWAAAFITQPPITRIQFRCPHYNARRKHTLSGLIIHRERGIVFGDITGTIRAHLVSSVNEHKIG